MNHRFVRHRFPDRQRRILWYLPLFLLACLLCAGPACAEEEPAAPDTYTICYDSNGASGSMAIEILDAGDELILPWPTFYNSQMEFCGWNTEPDGSGTTCAPEEGFIPSSDITFYAQWADFLSWKLLKYNLETQNEVWLNGMTVADGQDTQIVISSGRDVVLHLGGFTLLAEALDGYAFRIEEDASFTINDGSGGPWAVMAASSGRDDVLAASYYGEEVGYTGTGRIFVPSGGILNEGTFILDGGVLENAGADVAAILNNGYCELRQGVICGCQGDAVVNADEAGLRISGVFIQDNHGAGVMNDGLLLMEHGSIFRNLTGVVNNGFFEMREGLISKNSGGSAGGVDNRGEFTFTDGTIMDNTGTQAGGIKTTGTLSAPCGEILGNTGQTAGGIYAQGPVTLGYTAINGNRASDSTGAGAIYLAAGENADLCITRDIWIVDNYRQDQIGNVFLPSGQRLRIQSGPDEPVSQVCIGIISDAPQTGPVLTEGLPAWANEHIGLFSDDEAYYTALNEQGEAVLLPASGDTHTVTYMLDEDTVFAKIRVREGEVPPWYAPELEDAYLKEWVLRDGSVPDFPDGVVEDVTLYALLGHISGSDWGRLAAMISRGGFIRLVRNYAPESETDAGFTIPSGVSVKIDLNGYTIDGRSLNTPVFLVEPGASLTITDSRFESVNDHEVIVAAVYQVSGGRVQGGRGYAVETCGHFTLAGGILTDCIGLAAIHTGQGGECVMTGGSVENNSTRYGGVYNEGSLDMQQGVVRMNEGWDGAGGVTNKGTFTLNGGSIERNTGKEGNALTNYGSVFMTGGMIEQNNYDLYDTGTIFNAPSGRMTISGGMIISNYGKEYGGIYNLGQLTMSGGCLYGNYGEIVGGIWQAGGSLALTGGSITANNASSGIGGVGVQDGGLHLSGSPVVSGNLINGYQASDLLSATGQAMIIDDAMNPDFSVGIYTGQPVTSLVLTDGLEGRGNAAGFFSNNPAYEIGTEDGEAVLLERPVPGPEEETHFVRFYLDGSFVAERQVRDGEYAVPVAAPAVPWLEMYYWYLYDETTPFDFENTPITEDLALDGFFARRHLVSFSNGGGEGSIASQYVTSGQEITLPPCTIIPPAGMRFDHWEILYESGIYMPDDRITVTGDLHFLPCWEPEIYTITVDQDIPHGAITVEQDSYMTDDVIDIRILPDTGFELESLTYEAGGTGRTLYFDDQDMWDYYTLLPDTLPGDLMITGTFRMRRTYYQVSFTPVEGDEVSQQTWVFAGTCASEWTPDPLPERRGKRFTGWRLQGEEGMYDFESPVLCDLTLVGLWEDLPGYTIRLPETAFGTVSLSAETTVDGEQVSIPVVQDETLVYAGETVSLAIQADDGYGLRELSVTDSLGQELPVTDEYSFVMPEDTVLVMPAFGAAGMYSVSVAEDNAGTGDGVLQAKERADAGETVPVLVIPEDGCYIRSLMLTYELDGEAHEENLTGEECFVMPAADVTLTVVFSDYALRIDEEMQHGSVVTDQGSARAGEPVSLTIVPDEDYILERLTVTDVYRHPVTVTDGVFTMPEADVLIEASFRLANLFFVTFDSGTRDVVVETQEVWAGEYVQEPAPSVTERTGYELLGWYAPDADEPFDFTGTPVTGDLTLTARWEKLCRVRVYGFKGELYYTRYVRTGECVDEPTVYPVEGYTGEGWFYYGGMEPFDFATPITGDTSIAFIWQKNISTWNELRAMASTGEATRYILVNDVTRPANAGNISMAQGTSLSLDLNGHTLNVNGYDGWAFYVSNISTFRLRDTAGTGRITGAIKPVVLVAGGGRATMEGGTISGNTFLTIDSTIRRGCGAVYVMGGAYFTMNGGTIEDNTASGSGGGIYNEGHVAIHGGTIRNNTAIDGGGICNDLSGSLDLDGGEILANTATSKGGGICVRGLEGRTRMSGGRIAGNTAACGGGVYASMGSSSSRLFHVTGGEITGNTAGEAGGGVYSLSNGVAVGGDVCILDNTLTDGTPDNVSLKISNGYPVRISCPYALNAGARVGITCVDLPSWGEERIITNGLGRKADAGCFISDNPEYGIVIDPETGEAKLIRIPPAFLEPDFTLPASILEVGEAAFEGIAATSVRIPDGCSSVGEYAFKDCTVMAQIYIPESVTQVADNAFENCDNLKAVYGGSEARRIAESRDIYYGGELQ